jgi:hypothetical protein
VIWKITEDKKMPVKEHVIQALDIFSEAELRQVAEFVEFLKFRMRLQPTSTLDEAQLAALYAAGADEDQALAEAGLAEYVRGLCQEDAS